jgi:hypothetical protein
VLNYITCTNAQMLKSKLETSICGSENSVTTEDEATFPGKCVTRSYFTVNAFYHRKGDSPVNTCAVVAGGRGPCGGS